MLVKINKTVYLNQNPMDLNSSNQGKNFGGSYVSCGRAVTKNRHLEYCDPLVSLVGISS